MTDILLHHATIVPATGSSFLGWLLIHEGRIVLLGAGDDPFLESAASHQRIDAQGYWLVPGFIDLHVHGAVNYELMDANPDGLRTMAQFYAAHGVTAFLPTTWAAPPQALQLVIAMVDTLIGPVPGGASILGVHLEGPYLNPARCGAQDPQWIRRATSEEALPLLDSGIIRLVALAPEFPENRWLIRECLRRGITVSLAHSTATFAEANAAFAYGISQTTHTFNAMTGLGHREPGAVGAALAHPFVRSELIADLIHVHPVPLTMLLRVKGAHRIILITDAVRAAGLPDGTYTLGDRTVIVSHGAVRLLDGTLAGSTLTMDQALRNVHDVTGWPIEEIWPMASLTPAQAIGIAHTTGSIERGKDADLVLLDDQWRVVLTICRGHLVYQRSSVTAG